MRGIGADFEGCEIRVAAALSGDKALYEAETSDMCHYCAENPCGCGHKHTGLHWKTAHTAFGESATKEHRYGAKRGCVPVEGTEILTRRGWLTHDEVRAGDETPALQADGSMAWTRVMLVAHYPDAPLERLSVGKNWTAVATPDHRWATRKRRDGGAGGRYFEDGITHAHDLTSEHVIKLSGTGTEGTGLPISDAEAALIAWVYADGYLEQVPLTGRTAQGSDGRRRKIRARVIQAKPRGIAALQQVLHEANVPFKTRKQEPLADHHLQCYVYDLPTANVRDIWTRAGLIAVADKHAEGFSLREFTLALAASQRKAFLQAMEDSEGWRDKDGTLNIAQNAGPVLEAIELAGYLEGFYVKRYKHRAYKGNQHWKVTMTKPRVGCTRLRREDAGRSDVWCVQTWTGTWTMRQHGGPAMITGNTFTRFFGGGPATAADQVGCEVSLMEGLFEALNQVAPVYTAWDQWLRAKFDEGSLIYRDYETGTNYSIPIEGSKRLIYRAYSGRQIYVTRGPHAAGNGAIQGTARELLVDGILAWGQTRWGHLPLLPIHDQIEVLVPEAEAEAATLELVRCMESDVLSSPGFPVHISVDAELPWCSWPDSS